MRQHVVASVNQMVIKSIRCPVFGVHVTQVIDFEGAVTRVICAEYDESDGACRLMKSSSAAGPLSRFVDRASEGIVGTPAAACPLRAA